MGDSGDAADIESESSSAWSVEFYRARDRDDAETPMTSLACSTPHDDSTYSHYTYVTVNRRLVAIDGGSSRVRFEIGSVGGASSRRRVLLRVLVTILDAGWKRNCKAKL